MIIHLLKGCLVSIMWGKGILDKHMYNVRSTVAATQWLEIQHKYVNAFIFNYKCGNSLSIRETQTIDNRVHL